MRTRIGLLIFCALLSVPCLPAQEPDRSSLASLDQGKLIDAVLTGINANYSLIRTAEGTIDTTIERTWVTKEETVTKNLPDGTTMIVTLSPRQKDQRTFVIRGTDVRSEQIATFHPAPETIVLHQGVYTQLVRNPNDVWIRHPHQMPGMSPIDPRQLALHNIRESVQDLLTRNKGIDVAYKREPGKADSVTAKIKTTRGLTVLAEFTVSANFLPTTVTDLCDDGSLSVVTELTYTEVLPGSAWFPKKVIRRYFGKGIASTRDSRHWRELHTITIEPTLPVNRPVPDSAFHIQLPAGTTVHDSINSRNYQAGQEPADKNPMRVWLIITSFLTLLALACTFGLLLTKKKRAR